MLAPRYPSRRKTCSAAARMAWCLRTELAGKFGHVLLKVDTLY